MSKPFNILLFWLTRISVLLLSVVFIFSGFVKAVDPVGMVIKLNAYFQHWSFHIADNNIWLQMFVGAMAAIELLLGVNLLLGIRRKLTTIFTAIFMLVMTGITLYVFLYNPVPDCGCFGSALKLSNSETLLKNVVLLAASVFLSARPQYILRLISERNQWITAVCSLVYVVSVTVYSFRHLPVISFTPYNVGTNIKSAYEGNVPDQAAMELANIYIYTAKGEDVTYELLSDTSFTFLLTLPEEKEADDGNNDRINDLYDYCVDKHYKLIGVASQASGSFSDWIDRSGAAYPMFFGEPSQLKAMVRSNPGLLLLKNGVIIGKWSQNDLPSVDEQTQISEIVKSGNPTKSGLVLLLWWLIPVLLVILADRIWIGSKFYKHYIFKKKLKLTIMRKKIVAGNWKMNKNLQEGIALAKELNEKLTADAPKCDVVICTPFIHLASVASILNPELIGLGAENCADKEKGAYTGEVSAEMVKSTGAQYVILGHSERRAYYAETPEILREKVNLALANGLEVIFCIGEVLEDREANRQNDVVKAQLEGSLFNLTVEQFSHIILAYEPVWAIGTGKTATSEQAEEMHAFIRQTIAEKFGAEAAENVSILYGGSCKPSNAKELFSKPDVDGGLIGGAALQADDFKGIIDAWK